MTRTVIYKCVVGSKLYGTDGPDSDTDYAGVFIPSAQDLLGLQNCPTEWTFNEKVSTGPRNTVGDVDCKLFSLQRFLTLALQGQPGQLEFLFAPEDKVVETSHVWQVIRAHKRWMISKKSISPFIGFALAQAHKATIKGENLNTLRELRDNMKAHGAMSESIGFNLLALPEAMMLKGVRVYSNDFGHEIFEVAGRKFDLGLKLKTFVANIEELIKRYGTRSQAAAAGGYDFKSLMHAYRLLAQARQLLQTGHMTFPRPEAPFLKQIRAGEIDRDFHADLNAQLDELRQVLVPASALPEEPDYSKVNQLCIDMLTENLKGA